MFSVSLSLCRNQLKGQFRRPLQTSHHLTDTGRTPSDLINGLDFCQCCGSGYVFTDPDTGFFPIRIRIPDPVPDPSKKKNFFKGNNKYFGGNFCIQPKK